jgi:hypothetical protein
VHTHQSVLGSQGELFCREYKRRQKLLLSHRGLSPKAPRPNTPIQQPCLPCHLKLGQSLYTPDIALQTPQIIAHQIIARKTSQIIAHQTSCCKAPAPGQSLPLFELSLHLLWLNPLCRLLGSVLKQRIQQSLGGCAPQTIAHQTSQIMVLQSAGTKTEPLPPFALSLNTLKRPW